MSAQEQQQSASGGGIPTGPGESGAPKSLAKSSAAKLSGKDKNSVCLKCQRRMTVKQVKPLLFASNLDDVIFACDGCGSELKRTLKRS